MNFATIPDRVPVDVIQAFTNAALRVYLERHGWAQRGEWQHKDGSILPLFIRGRTEIPVPSHNRFTDHVLLMGQAIGYIVISENLRSADVIAEMQAIAEWQRRCAEWVEPRPGEPCPCYECGQPRPTFAVCPCCGNKRCPRATDHRHGCSGSNEPGQVGSRYV